MTMKKVILQDQHNNDYQYFLLTEKEINLKEACELAYNLTKEEKATIIESAGITATNGFWIMKRDLSNQLVSVFRIESLDGIKFIE